MSDLSEYRKEYLSAIKNAGSIVYRARNPGKSFAWYMRFKSKKDYFSDKNLFRVGIYTFLDTVVCVLTEKVPMIISNC